MSMAYRRLLGADHWFRTPAITMLGVTLAAGGECLHAQSTRDLVQLYEHGRFFELRVALDAAPAVDSPEAQVLRAAVSWAFNDPAQSNRELSKLSRDARELPAELRAKVYRLRILSHSRQHDYASAAGAADAMRKLPGIDAATLRSTDAEERIVRALAGLPPQRVVHRRGSAIRRGRDSHVPVHMGDSLREYVLDASASISVVTRSEAEVLGLLVSAADVLVATSTGTVVEADVTIAPRVKLGGVELANVAFLVVPDEVLEVGPGFSVQGVLGFPIVDALGEMEFRRDGVLRIPEAVPERKIRNLAMDDLRPLVQVQVLGQTAVCELDADVSQSVLYLPFVERVRSRIGAEARMDTIRTGGAVGESRVRAYILHDVSLTLGGKAVELRRLPVYPNTSTGNSKEAADCRLGTDVLHASGGYVLNLRSMALLPL